MTTAGFITVITTVIVVITAPVDVDTASVITGELSERETGWVCAGRRLIGAIPAVIIQVTFPGVGNTAATGTRVLIRRTRPS